MFVTCVILILIYFYCFDVFLFVCYFYCLRTGIGQCHCWDADNTCSLTLIAVTQSIPFRRDFFHYLTIVEKYENIMAIIGYLLCSSLFFLLVYLLKVLPLFNFILFWICWCASLSLFFFLVLWSTITKLNVQTKKKIEIELNHETQKSIKNF